jgi:hypothetical protein
VVHVWEENPTANAEPLEWFLLTTIDIKIKVLKAYSKKTLLPLKL